MKPIPAPLAEVYDELKLEVTWLHGRWMVYKQLFGRSDRRIEMLNECASVFFYIIQDVLLGDIQVSFTKLTDPARTGRHDRLSLEQLQERLDKHGETNLADKTRVVLASLRIKCKPFRTW
jgi:hypothetical protein